MVSRKTVPKTIQTDILTECRKRCCFCFGLNRDISIKPGQIAHIDRDSSNNAQSNLVYMCLEHHDQYDTRTSQSKGLTEGEARAYQGELLDALNRMLGVKVHFGEIEIPSADPYAGTYLQIGVSSDVASEITLTPAPDSPEGLLQYVVNGTALWIGVPGTGPNIGMMNFLGAVYDGHIVQSYPNGNKIHSIDIQFNQTGLSIEEENWFGAYGMNVNFIGEYRKI